MNTELFVAIEEDKTFDGSYVQTHHQEKLRYQVKHYYIEKKDGTFATTTQPITFVQLENAIPKEEIDYTFVLKEALFVQPEEEIIPEEDAAVAPSKDKKKKITTKTEPEA